MLVGLVFIALAQPRVSGQTPEIQFQGAARTLLGEMKRPTEPAALAVLNLATDYTARKRLTTAQDYLNAEQWSDGVRLLQTLLDAKEDGFVPVSGRDAQGCASTRWVSARTEAERLLQGLPDKALEFYELQFGARARKQLNETGSDPQLLADAGRRFGHTQAGGEALDRLGSYYLDRGQATLATICFERLLGTRRSVASDDRQSAATLYRAALAFHLLGDRTRAEQAWQRLAAVGTEGVRLGARTVRLDELRRALDSRRPATANWADWPLFAGAADRNGTALAVAPYLEPAWRTDLSSSADGRAWMQKATRPAASDRTRMLPGSFPILSAGKLIYRSAGGIHALDPQTGQELWRSPDALGFDALLAEPGKKVQIEDWLDRQYGGALSYLVENSLVGTLSADGRHVYAVEDLPVPLPPALIQFTEQGVPRPLGPLKPFITFNQLKALDLETGQVVWRLHDRTKSDAPAASTPAPAPMVGPNGQPAGLLAATDSYFLGPPLPLGGKLYAPLENNGELRLVCIDSAAGTILWAQPLATIREKHDAMPLDAGRRLHAVHLAYGDGTLVCLTHAGAIFGVDLLSHSLVWAHGYRERRPQPGPNEETQPVVAAESPVETWKTSAPTVADGKIVCTPADDPAIRCLNLRDGSLVWKADRSQEDLYLAGVHHNKVLLVGTGSCRALNLANGSETWRTATGMPAGRGIASADVYYLPLRRGSLWSLDIATGAVLARAAARSAEPLGNLLFHNGRLVSQSFTALAGYASLAEQLARLRPKPGDFAALLKRGMLRTEQGKWSDAVADFRAVATLATGDLRKQAADKLLGALTEWLQSDFNAAEPLLDEYRRLRDNAELSARERSVRQSGFLVLLGRGREQQGRRIDAWRAYQEWYALGDTLDPLPLANDTAVTAAADVWLQQRVAALLADSNAEQRRGVEHEIQRELQDALRADDGRLLSRLVAVYGSLLPAGREARLQLADRLGADTDRGRFLEAESQLLRLLSDETNPERRNCALDLLARLSAKRGLPEDAVAHYRLLPQNDALKECTADPRFLPYLAARPWPGLRPEAAGTLTSNPTLGFPAALPWVDLFLGVQTGLGHPQLMPKPSAHVMQTTGTFSARAFVAFEPQGEVLPFFRRHALGIDLTTSELKFLDRATGAERWNLHLGLLPLRNFLNAPQINSRVRYGVVGHIVTLHLGHAVYGIDALVGRVLWKLRLTDRDATSDGLTYYSDPSGALVCAIHPYTPQAFVTWAGYADLLSPECLCVRTPRALVGLDPLTGVVRWSRAGHFGDGDLFGGGDLVFHEGPLQPHAFRMRDGSSVAAPDFADLIPNVVRRTAHGMLVAEPQANGLVLHYRDLRTGTDLWRRSYPANTIVVKSESDWTGVIEPSGKVTVLELRTGNIAVQTSVDPQQLQKVQTVYLLHDPMHFYLACNAPPDASAGMMGQPWANVRGVRCLPVNGMFFAFCRITGALHWHYRLPPQMLILDSFEALPILLFSVGYNRQTREGMNRGAVQVTETWSVDKLTGKLLFETTDASGGGNLLFTAFQVDLRMGTVDLVAPRLRLRHMIN
jgi:outer membrane protein assembly factor BamB